MEGSFISLQLVVRAEGVQASQAPRKKKQKRMKMKTTLTFAFDEFWRFLGPGRGGRDRVEH